MRKKLSTRSTTGLNFWTVEFYSQSFIFCLLFLPVLAYAKCETPECVPSIAETKYIYPYYLSVFGGYGSTTWGQLVPQKANQNAAINMSTPINAQEGGGIWGLTFGYEFIPTFGLEVDYVHYPAATVIFDPDSIFTFDHNGITRFTSQTESFNLIGKFMLIIPNTGVRAFSSVGAAMVHRYDIIDDTWQLSPVFGVGINYNVTPRIMLELGIDYTAGYGKSELDPANDFVPFLYSSFLRIGYRF